MESSKSDTLEKSNTILSEVAKVLIEDPNNLQAKIVQERIKLIKSKFEQSESTTISVVKNQLESFKKENEFALKNVSWTGLLSMIKQESLW